MNADVAFGYIETNIFFPIVIGAVATVLPFFFVPFASAIRIEASI